MITIPAGLTFLVLSCNDGKDQERPVLPKGDRTPSAHFTGTVWLHPLVANNSAFHLVLGNVTFEAGARSKGYSHPAGQLLLLTAGVCYTRQRGKPQQVYRNGDVVRCLPNVEHWHGASPDSSMTHIAVNPNTENSIVTWLKPVTDD